MNTAAANRRHEPFVEPIARPRGERGAERADQRKSEYQDSGLTARVCERRSFRARPRRRRADSRAACKSRRTPARARQTNRRTARVTRGRVCGCGTAVAALAADVRRGYRAGRQAAARASTPPSIRALVMKLAASAPIAFPALAVPPSTTTRFRCARARRSRE